jgi:hypothetical protein
MTEFTESPAYFRAAAGGIYYCNIDYLCILFLHVILCGVLDRFVASDVSVDVGQEFRAVQRSNMGGVDFVKAVRGVRRYHDSVC